MRRSMVIASTALDPAATPQLLDGFARLEPTAIPVFTTFEDSTEPVGHCLRLWRKKKQLWAEMEISDSAYWPGPHEPHPAPVHAEMLVAYQGSKADLIGVVITSLPRGKLAEAVASWRN